MLSVNGYNERLLHYGREDDDLCDRLVAGGLRRVDLDLTTIIHIPHSNSQRYRHLKIAKKIPPLPNYDSKKHFEKSAECVINKLIMMSYKIIAETPWTTQDHMTRWKTDMLTPNHITCEELPKETPDKKKQGHVVPALGL